MKWVKFNRNDDRDVFMRDDDIDYIVVYGKWAKIYQKNGSNQLVKSFDVWPKIVEDQLIAAEKKKLEVNVLNGMAVARSLPDYDLEILRNEIQDLKLENDRLKKRDEIMVHFLRSIRCQGMFCGKCDLYSDQGCYWLDNPSCKDMWNSIDDVFKKLEDL